MKATSSAAAENRLSLLDASRSTKFLPPESAQDNTSVMLLSIPVNSLIRDQQIQVHSDHDIYDQSLHAWMPSLLLLIAVDQSADSLATDSTTKSSQVPTRFPMQPHQLDLLPCHQRNYPP